MNYNILFIFSCLALLTFSSCSNEVDVIGEYKEIPVVYGIMDIQTDTNYIRIEKAFLSPDQDAYLVAQTEDSIYFNEADLRVEMYKNGVFQQELQRVNLRDEGIVRDSGLLLRDPAYAYRYTLPIFQNAEYELVLNTAKKTYRATSRTPSRGTAIVYLLPDSDAEWVGINTFTNEYMFKDVTVGLTQQPQPALIYDVNLKVHYKEFQVDLATAGEPQIGPSTAKYLTWTPVKSYILTGENFEPRKLSKDAFFAFLKANLSSVAGTDTRRCLSHIEVEVVGGSESIAEFGKSSGVNTSLISGLAPAKIYTNIEGGVGVFGSKYTINTVRNKVYNIGEYTRQYLNETEEYQMLGIKSGFCN